MPPKKTPQTDPRRYRLIGVHCGSRSNQSDDIKILSMGEFLKAHFSEKIL
jgi:hypothetical protein